MIPQKQTDIIDIDIEDNQNKKIVSSKKQKINEIRYYNKQGGQDDHPLKGTNRLSFSAKKPLKTM